MQYGFEWLLGIAERHVCQLLCAKRAGTLVEVLAEILEQTKTSWTLQECYTWLDSLEATCATSGFFVLDPSPHPEVWNPPALPQMVRASVFFVDPDIYNSVRLLKRYKGETLSPTLSDETRNEELAHLRHSIIYHQPCRTDGCDQVVVVTLGQAGRAIEKYNLAGPDRSYQHSRFCKACQQRNAESKLPEGRTSDQPASKKSPRKNKKGIATLGEVAAAHNPTTESERETT